MFDVNVPARKAYNQWTQFEEFPHFMSFVESITQKTDTLTHWKVKIAGAEREFRFPGAQGSVIRVTVRTRGPGVRVASVFGPDGSETEGGIASFRQRGSVLAATLRPAAGNRDRHSRQQRKSRPPPREVRPACP